MFSWGHSDEGSKLLDMTSPENMGRQYYSNVADAKEFRPFAALRETYLSFW
jgi:hypothetical protein